MDDRECLFAINIRTSMDEYDIAIAGQTLRFVLCATDREETRKTHRTMTNAHIWQTDRDPTQSTHSTSSHPLTDAASGHTDTKL
mmetsp:Transcript_4964/g.13496  ORF Transcript_4964/g.13496 Transcript_4964/m.13496 type:complete len:84 (-) Transcript_4964:387-638(-)